jgi:hypothetical protein
MRHIIIGVLMLGTMMPIHAQDILSWMELTSTKVSTDFDNPQNFKPDFYQGLYEREHNQVMLTGYIIPIDVAQNTYALSMNPFSNCFFCGQAGVETVVELHFAEKRQSFKVDDYVVLTGTFRLNRNPGMGFIYALHDAKLKK